MILQNIILNPAQLELLVQAPQEAADAAQSAETAAEDAANRAEAAAANILTGRINSIQRIYKMIEDRGLQRDVISLPGVPNHVLAALYRLATLSVTPTQFEGGFPFTFSEAYSVGTPSIMSRIPVVTELLDDPELLSLMTFDPLDRDEMRRKILWGLSNVDELFERQKPLFEKMSARTWPGVAGEYLDLILSTAQSEKKQRIGRNDR